jgi:hypothetical protein
MKSMYWSQIGPLTDKEAVSLDTETENRLQGGSMTSDELANAEYEILRDMKDRFGWYDIPQGAHIGDLLPLDAVVTDLED